MRQIEVADRIAAARWLDGVASAVRGVTRKLIRPGRVKDALHGVWLGHPVHPALAQVAVGCFTGAAVLDLTGDQDGAVRLIRFGLLGSLPTAAAGLADNAEGLADQQRIGVVHGTVNVAALGSYLLSLRLRASGRRGGVATGLAAYALVAAGAALGGDLAFRWAMGPNHAAGLPQAGPRDWTDLGAVGDFTEGTPARVTAGQVPALVLVADGEIFVVYDRCGHLAGPLHQGNVVREDGQWCVACPWHGSTFRVSDGAIVRGPATVPQPVLDSRVENGRLQARVRPAP
ncbi:Rieske 2Fe-2S domain-containing protein [Amycolatopsis pithecellobii]|uniref:Rieske 2Fe-2S domain-containing protein n=1 Tax=Amycolatopsis pithecellobii TaxID=664692 RepID=A0A6N7YJ52_9PSEU|nr:Rieske (2Fe-2S) protein [Amycolatopsis pithecellobii]MTD52935.1 Rieske 2Fe-2S domain-containing protein [Amycolatopsis pithecellobii]